MMSVDMENSQGGESLGGTTRSSVLYILRALDSGDKSKCRNRKILGDVGLTGWMGLDVGRVGCQLKDSV